MKETKIEKLILDLSNRWDCSPQEAVDRLNSMNESEINKLINSMTKKFKSGGMIDCLRKGGSIKDCGCGSKIEKAQGGKSDLGKYHLQLSNGNNYGLSGYGLNPQRTVETLTTPEDVITRTIERGDTTVTRNGQPFVPTMRFHQNFDEMKEKAILANKGQDYLDYKKRTGTFDEGGKVRGGNWRDYHTIINAPGDTLRFKQYFSGPAYMQTHPEGGITYERSTRDGVTRMYDENYKPSWWELNVLGYQPVTTEEKENWQQLIKNHANDPAVKDKTQKKQEGGTITPHISVVYDDDQSDGPVLTRRQSRELSELNKGFNRSQWRTAYQNAKNALRENSDLRGKDLRQASRRMASGIRTSQNTYTLDNIPAQLNVPAITGPKRYNEAVTSVGDLTEIGTPVVVETPISQIPVAPIKPEVYGPSNDQWLNDRRAKTDAWYQYQYERQLFDQANRNYRPNQDSAAYQHWMWKDFNDAWDPETKSAKRDFRMRVPSQDELLQFMDAGEFTHGALPMSRQRQMEYGVDHDARNWYFNDDSRYGVDANAQYSGIPHTSDLYDGVARTMMSTIASTYNPTINVAKIPGQTGTLMGAADDLARAGNYQSPRLVDKNGRVLKSLDEYKYRPRKRRTTGGPKPPTYPTIDPTVPPVDVSNITRPASPFIDFENLSRWFKKQGGKL